MSEFPKPSVYVPLARRFGNERERELRETRELYATLKARHDALDETCTSFCELFYRAIREYPEGVWQTAAFAVWDIVSAERQIWELPPPAVERMTMQEYVEYRNLLYAKEHFFANQAQLLEALYNGVERILEGVAAELPQSEAPSPFTIPLVNALPDPKLTIQKVLNTLAESEDAGLFKALSERLYLNLCAASGRDPNDQHSRKPFIAPAHSALPPSELVDAYLGGTPLHALFTVPVPLKLTHEDRFNHMHVIGGSGSGKTTLIENLIRHDLVSPSPPSIVLIDPHSDLVRKLVRSDLGIDDRIILIDPRDTTHPLALNPFAVNRERIDSYDAATREQVTAGVIQTFGYLWSGLTNLRLMSDPAPYAADIEALPEIPRAFFHHDFASKSFEGTREQIRYRLQAIIENPTLARLFTAPETKVDFFTEMNRGAVILVDTAKDFLKEGSAIFGKLMLSVVLQAVLERAAIPEGERTPTFIMVDEAGSFFSTNIDDLLTEARKYKAGLLLAHQYLDQATSSLRASLAANAAIKFASGLSAQDATVMARDMRTTPDFILSQPRLQFAAHIRNVTPQAVSIPIEPVRGAPQLSAERYEVLLVRNRARVSMPQEVRNAARPSPAAAAEAGPGEDISREW